MPIPNEIPRYILAIVSEYYVDAGLKFMIPCEEITEGIQEQLEVAESIGISHCEDDIADLSEDERQGLYEISSRFYDTEIFGFDETRHHRGDWRKHLMDESKEYVVSGVYVWSFKY